MIPTRDLALIQLGCIRRLLVEASGRRLGLGEAEVLAAHVISLAGSVGSDSFALNQIESLERDIQQEFAAEWPGSQSIRDNAMITTHVLSGHLLGAE